METAQNKMTKETLGQLIIDSKETMYRIAKSLLYNDADCADAIQEAIVKAFAKLHTLKDDSYAKTWLIRTVLYGRVQCERGRSIVRYDRECSKKQAGKSAGKIKRSAGRLRHSDDPLEQTYKNTDIE